MSIGIMFDWSENFNNETGEDTFDLTCPNTEHHDKYGRGYETEYGATEDIHGDECESYDGCPCCEDDSGNLSPMMNFIYPLDFQGFMEGDEGEKLRTKIALDTSCVCVENNKTGEWFLTLTGGGMDLSFSIAHAYMIAQKWLPLDLLSQLNAGWCKSNLSKKNFLKLRKICSEQLQNEISTFREKKEKWDLPIEEISQ